MDPAPTLLGLDVGGGGVRALAIDSRGTTSASAHVPLRARPSPGTYGIGFDLDLPAILQAVARAVRECLGKAGNRPESVAAIACTSMRMSTVVRGPGAEVLLAVPNRDARAAGPGLRLAAEHGQQLHERTGHWPYPIYSAARLLWLAETEPDAYARATAVLSPNEWLAEWLCGERAADPTQAGETLLLDLHSRRWAEDLIGELALPTKLFPTVAEPGTALGTLRREAATALGLEPSVIVGVGAADTQAALLGCNLLDPGGAAAVAGTTAPVQLVLDTPEIDSQARVWTGQHVIPGRWVLESNAGPLGEALDWFASLLHPDDRDPLARLLTDAAEAETSGAMLSTLGAEIMHARERGIPFASISMTHMASAAGEPSRRALSRAVVEGVACALHGNLEQLADIAHREVDRLYLTGGLSRSASFARLLARISGSPVHVSARVEASALGAAACAGVAAGAFEDLRSAAGALARDEHIEDADAEGRESGAALYAAWRTHHDERIAVEHAAGARATGAVLEANRGPAEAAGSTRALRILATADLDDSSLAALRELGEVEYASYRAVGRMLKGEALIEALQGFDTFLTEIDVVDADAFAALPALRVVVSCRGDAVNVDARAATLHGIPVLNTPGRNADAVADLALAFLLMLARQLAPATRFLREQPHEGGDLATMGRAFASLRGRELWRSTIGLVGFGAVGRAVADRLRGFGAQVLVTDPFVSEGETARHDAQRVELAELLERSDFVSLHAPVTEATRGLLDASAISKMKPTAMLINTARAALVDETALGDALTEGRLAGAALDVFSVEPPGSGHPLLALPNVIATPHVGGNTVQVSTHQGLIAAADLGRLLRGERPLHAVNPETLDAFDWGAERPVPGSSALEAIRNTAGPAVSDLLRKPKGGPT